MYDFTCQLATLEPPPPPMQQLFAALRGNQEATNQFYSAITGSRPLPEFMNPENIGRIMATAGAGVKTKGRPCGPPCRNRMISGMMKVGSGGWI